MLFNTTMKMFKLISFFTLSLLFLIPSSLFSQSPLGIPYQAVLRNADWSIMASSAVGLTFMIHDGTETGTVVFEETHALNTNAQGLVSCVVGNGVLTQGNFQNINWGNGAKFLHIQYQGSNVTVDLGTQQMMSVPYALYAEQTNVRVSAVGDTLSIGGQSVIVPGISAANAIVPVSNSGLGVVLLPGNTICANEFISVTGCGGQTSLTYDDRTYDLVEIGGQCWFADNLATDQYRNGDLIPTGLDDASWGATTSGAYAIYNDHPANDAIYGKLYNWYTTADNRGVCPTGWHVPTDCEWMYLEGSLGMSVQDQTNTGWRGSIESNSLKSSSGWYSNLGNNSTGFNAVPSGKKEFLGPYTWLIEDSFYWTSTGGDFIGGSLRQLFYGSGAIGRNNLNLRYGHSIRCLKD